MKSIVTLFLSIYLFAGSLMPGSSFANLSQLPSLFRHYVFHTNVETPGVSFTEYMVMHYSNGEHEKSDTTHHNQLPLHHKVNSMQVDQMTNSGNFDKLFDFKFELKSIIPVYYITYFPSGICQGVFHPPKG